MLAHLARNVGKNLVSVGQLHPEHRVGKCFDYRAFDFDDTVFVGHGLACLADGLFELVVLEWLARKPLTHQRDILLALAGLHKSLRALNPATRKRGENSAGHLVDFTNAVNRDEKTLTAVHVDQGSRLVFVHP